jgi:adenylate cyclase
MYLVYLAGAHSALGRYEDAIELFKQVLKRSPKNLFAHTGLTSNYIALGREEEARHQAEKLLELDPAFSLVRYAEIGYTEDKEAKRVLDNLRKAGLK